MKASATGFTRSPDELQPDVSVHMSRQEAEELVASLEHCVAHVLGGHRHPTMRRALELLDELNQLPQARPPEITRGKKPSAGRAGTNGCFVVEVINHTGTRALARRFKTLAEAEEFHTRSVGAHQAKADRERHWYIVALYETATPKSTDIFKEQLILVEPR